MHCFSWLRMIKFEFVYLNFKISRRSMVTLHDAQENYKNGTIHACLTRITCSSQNIQENFHFVRRALFQSSLESRVTTNDYFCFTIGCLCSWADKKMNVKRRAFNFGQAVVHFMGMDILKCQLFVKKWAWQTSQPRAAAGAQFSLVRNSPQLIKLHTNRVSPFHPFKDCH